MTSEQGTVVEVMDGKAMVKATSSSACEDCGTKQLCVSTDDKDMLIEVDNPIHAKKGDTVTFAIGSSTLMKTGVVIYLIPLLGFLFGVVIGKAYIAPLFRGRDSDLVAALSGFIILILTFIGVRFYASWSEKKGSLRPKIVKVLN